MLPQQAGYMYIGPQCLGYKFEWDSHSQNQKGMSSYPFETGARICQILAGNSSLGNSWPKLSLYIVTWVHMSQMGMKFGVKFMNMHDVSLLCSPPLLLLIRSYRHTCNVPPAHIGQSRVAMPTSTRASYFIFILEIFPPWSMSTYYILHTNSSCKG